MVVVSHDGLHTIDQHLTDYFTRARLPAAA
jgi:hypothetical protein